MSITVDLPAPFGPSSATVSPGATVEVDPAHGPHRPGRARERLHEPVELHARDVRRRSCSDHRCLHAPHPGGSAPRPPDADVIDRP